MIGFLSLRRCPPDQVDARWKEIRRQEQELHKKWGLGWGEDSAGYRERLKRLCQFRLALEPEDGSDPRRSDFEKLQDAFAKWRNGRQDANGDYSQRLQALSDELKKLQREVSAGREESEEEYLDRWVLSQGNGHQALGVLAPEGPMKTLKALGDALNPLEKEPNQAARAAEARARWRELVRDCITDWEWAYFQVMVRRAQESLQSTPAEGKPAAELLNDAIGKLEKRGFLQPRLQGLYSRLAESLLLQAKAASGKSEKPLERIEKIQEALTYARRAVEMEPENVSHRRVLLEVLSLLGDFEEMKIEAEIARNLDSGPETLRAIGTGFWKRAASLRTRGAHEKTLREAVTFFEDARRHAEGAPLDKSCPLKQMETHGWAHYWLGRFQGELGHSDEAVEHLRTAAELGFKPLESKVRLAWIHLESRAYERADQAFADAAAEAAKWSSGEKPEPVAQAPGEDRPIEELRFETYLGRAFLASVAPPEPEKGTTEAETGQQDSGARKEPEKRITEAEAYLSSSAALKERKDFQAMLHEALGRSHLGNGKLEEAVKELEAAVRLSPRSSAYCYLASARLEQAQATKDDAEKSEALRKAREAYRLAVDTDPWGRQGRELWRLGRQLQNFQGTEPTPQKPGG